jgi:diguanylate cyclase (GGDEF)-like protein
MVSGGNAGPVLAGLAGDVLDALPDATAVLDTSGSIVAVNYTWRMFALDNGGRPDMTGVGVNYLDLCARSAAAGCEDARMVVIGMRAVLAGETVYSELEYPCPSPAANRWFLLRITSLAGAAPGAVASHVNITRRKMAELILAHEASHDPLTGLANRDLLTARLAAALARRSGRPAGGDIGLLYVDLDDFKHINDTYGHDAGDEVLLTTAHRLRAEVRPQDTVARLGGDEFAVTAPRISTGGLAAMAARISAAIAEPHLIHGQSVRVRASVGTYMAAAGDHVAEALRQADQAMYAVKRTRVPGAPSPPDPGR